MVILLFPNKDNNYKSNGSKYYVKELSLKMRCGEKCCLFFKQSFQSLVAFATKVCKSKRVLKKKVLLYSLNVGLYLFGLGGLADRQSPVPYSIKLS